MLLLPLLVETLLLYTALVLRFDLPKQSLALTNLLGKVRFYLFFRRWWNVEKEVLDAIFETATERPDSMHDLLLTW